MTLRKTPEGGRRVRAISETQKMCPTGCAWGEIQMSVSSVQIQAAMRRMHAWKNKCQMLLPTGLIVPRCLRGR